ncbi:MAG: hypothetical protein Q8N98_00050 [bacterium]|nr:hypothetical protein [bacterium]
MIREELKIFWEKIKDLLLFLKRFPWTIGENVFPFFVVMIILAVVVGTLFFFKFQSPVLPVSSELPVLDEPRLEKILQNWQERRQKLEAADAADYPDLFSPKGE